MNAEKPCEQCDARSIVPGMQRQMPEIDADGMNGASQQQLKEDDEGRQNGADRELSGDEATGNRSHRRSPAAQRHAKSSGRTGQQREHRGGGEAGEQ